MNIVSDRARARAHDLLRKRRLGQAVEVLDAGAIPEAMGFREWCEDLGRKGLQIDRKPFRLDDRPALLPIYDAIPTTRAEAAGRTLVIQKATQLGLTVWETLADIYMARKWGPVNIGLYLPDQATASFKSHHRFMPIVRSSPILYRELVTRPQGEARTSSATEGNVMTRQFGKSLIMFLWTSGRLSTESRPMDIVSLDEVQGMSLEAIDKVRARTGDSAVRFTLLLSTANMPDADINAWYARGTQEIWHTECEHCGVLSDLSDPGTHFPEASIGYATGDAYPTAPREEYVWTCPACRGWIANPQRGRYVCQNPAAEPTGVRSFLLPRTISPRMTPREMISDWRHARTGDQRKSFYNRTLARPYIDVDQLPVTLAHCEAAAVEGRRLGLEWETEAQPGASYYMGVDQMGGWNAVIIKRRLPDGRQAVAHAEAIYGEEPFEATAALMERFRISVCVVEQLPNVNSARRFANAHLGRVFLNTRFTTAAAEMLDWEDQRDRSDRRTAPDAVTQYTLGVNQYKLMQSALYRVRDLGCLFPDPDALEQTIHGPHGPERVKLLRDQVFLHLTKTALVVEQDEQTRKPRAFVRKVGLDPHFAFANMLCDAAWAREQGSGSIFIPGLPLSVGALPVKAGAAKSAEGAVIGQVPVVVPAMRAPSTNCGGCMAFNADRGWCNERKVRTGPQEHPCSLFVKKGVT